MAEGQTCYENDEAFCEDQMCLRTGCRLKNASAPETLGEEFERLVKEYETGEGSEKEEAWNLIADFAVDNYAKISAALHRMFPDSL